MKDDFSERYQKALDEYKADLGQLAGIETRLVAKLKGKPGAPELKTIEAQLEKLPASRAEVEQRFNAKVDGVNEAIVMRFRGLCAYALGSGNGNAGLQLLYDECKDFESAKGDYERRKALYNGIVTLAESVADASLKSSNVVILSLGERPGAEQLAIYEQFNAMPASEAKTAFYNKNRKVILAIEDLRKLSK